MQAQGQKDNQNNDDLEKIFEQQFELSEVWRQLLGMEAQASTFPASSDVAMVVVDTDSQEGVPVLSDDPWTHLLHAQGIQVVDLQQTHLHTAQTSAEDSDVEHALDIMQENLPEK